MKTISRKDAIALMEKVLKESGYKRKGPFYFQDLFVGAEFRCKGVIYTINSIDVENNEIQGLVEEHQGTSSFIDSIDGFLESINDDDFILVNP